MIYGLTNGCETKKLKCTLSAEEFLREYVDVPRFLACCRACPHYEKRWCCPPFAFDPAELWRQYRRVELTAMQILPRTEEAKAKALTDAEGLLRPFAAALDEGLMFREKGKAGALALKAGKCRLCTRCAREEGKPCRMPEQMRWSIEALGGNVSAVTEKLLDLPLCWGTKDTAPEYFVLVGALLTK